MSLTLEAGEVRLGDWSSNDKNLLLPNSISASFSIAAVDRREKAQLISDVETVLATIPAGSEFIIGHTIRNGRKYSIGGDQIVLLSTEKMQNAASYTASTSTGVDAVASAIWYNIFISGTQLRVRVSYRFPSAAKALFAATTVKVVAMVGAFEF